MLGDAGDDHLAGGQGDDVAKGGGGDDTLVVTILSDGCDAYDGSRGVDALGFSDAGQSRPDEPSQAAARPNCMSMSCGGTRSSSWPRSTAASAMGADHHIQ